MHPVAGAQSAADRDGSVDPSPPTGTVPIFAGSRRAEAILMHSFTDSHDQVKSAVLHNDEGLKWVALPVMQPVLPSSATTCPSPTPCVLQECSNSYRSFQIVGTSENVQKPAVP